MSVSVDGQDQSIDVLFVANPPPTTLSWHHKNGDEVVDNQRFVVELIEPNDTQDIYTSRMTIRNITFNDYRTYELKVENDIGYFTTEADMKNPNEGMYICTCKRVNFIYNCYYLNQTSNNQFSGN